MTSIMSQREVKAIQDICETIIHHFIHPESPLIQSWKTSMEHLSLYPVIDSLCNCLEKHQFMKPREEWPLSDTVSSLIRKMCQSKIDNLLLKLVQGHYGDDEIYEDDLQLSGDEDGMLTKDLHPQGIGKGGVSSGATPPPSSNLHLVERTTTSSSNIKRRNTNSAIDITPPVQVKQVSERIRLKPWKHHERNETISRSGSGNLAASLHLQDAISSDLSSLGSMDLATIAEATKESLPSPTSPLNPYYLIDTLAKHGTNSPTSHAPVHLHRPEIVDQTVDGPTLKYSSFRLVMALFYLYVHAKMEITHDAVFSLTDLLTRRLHPEKAIHIFELMLEMKEHETWLLDLRIAKSMVFLYVIKRPADLLRAQNIIRQHTALKHSLRHAHDEQHKNSEHVLWLYFMSLVREAKWSDCMERYEEAKVNQTVETRNTNLDSCMMEVSTTYNEFEYGWLVFNQIKKLDRYSIIAATMLTWKAYFCADNDNQKLIWEARCWAVLHGFQQLSTKDRQQSAGFLRKHIAEIVEDLPNPHVRTEKMNQLQKILETS